MIIPVEILKTKIMAKSYIAKAKEKAIWLIKSPLAGNSENDVSIPRAIDFVKGLRFYETQTKEIKFWARVLKELNKMME